MDKEPRKASEVLLELETKVDKLVGLVTSQDQLIKVLSNKLNVLMEKIDKQPAVAPKITVEAVANNPFTMVPEPDPEKALPVASDFNLPVESAPNGFRRTSRPETYSGDNAYLPHAPKPVETSKYPVQVPKPSGKAEVVVPANINRTPGQSLPTTPAPTEKAKQPYEITSTSTIPVTQRVVGANGKPAFLADVEITDLSTMQLAFKTRTNGTGKWTAPLPIGAYRVTIRKRESLTKEKIEAAQDIQVDGTQSPLELPLMIIQK